MLHLLSAAGVLAAFLGAFLPPLQALFPRIWLITYRRQRATRRALGVAGMAGAGASLLAVPSPGAWACAGAALLLGILSEALLVTRTLIPPLDDPPATPTSPGPGRVMAIELNGQAHAYPMELLIPHHIVNETVAGVAVVATFCPACRSGAVFGATVGGRRLRFEPVSVRRRNMVMRDRETGTVWQQETGEALAGPLSGTILELLGGEILARAAWCAAHPHGTICSRPPGYRHPHPAGRHFARLLDEGPRHLVGPGLHGLDRRLDQHAEVAGIVAGGTAKAYPLAVLARGMAVEDVVGGIAVRVSYDATADRVSAEAAGTPCRVSREWWLGWSEYHPGSEVYDGGTGGAGVASPTRSRSPGSRNSRPRSRPGG